MTTHLPDCWATDPSDPPAWCICDELRACEQRVISEAVQRVEALNWIIPEGRVGKWVVGYQTPGYPDQPPPNAGLLRTQTIAAIKGDHP